MTTDRSCPIIGYRLTSWVALEKLLMWAEVSARTRHRCFYCNGRAEDWTRGWTLEHLVPRRYRGSSLPFNLVRACEPCNQRRGSSPNLRLFMHHTEPWRLELLLGAERRLHRLLYSEIPEGSLP